MNNGRLQQTMEGRVRRRILTISKFSFHIYDKWAKDVYSIVRNFEWESARNVYIRDR